MLQLTYEVTDMEVSEGLIRLFRDIECAYNNWLGNIDPLVNSEHRQDQLLSMGEWCLRHTMRLRDNFDETTDGRQRVRSESLPDGERMRAFLIPTKRSQEHGTLNSSSHVDTTTTHLCGHPFKSLTATQSLRYGQEPRSDRPSVKLAYDWCGAFHLRSEEQFKTRGRRSEPSTRPRLPGGLVLEGKGSKSKSKLYFKPQFCHGDAWGYGGLFRSRTSDGKHRFDSFGELYNTVPPDEKASRMKLPIFDSVISRYKYPASRQRNSHNLAGEGGQGSQSTR